MYNRKVFEVVSGICGVNFASICLLPRAILAIHIFINFIDLLLQGLWISISKIGLDFFLFADFIEIYLPFLLQNYFAIRAYCLRRHCAKIEQALGGLSSENVRLKCSQKFLKFFYILILSRVVKISFMSSYAAIINTLMSVIPEIVCCCNAFMFAYYTNSLKYTLREMRDNLTANINETSLKKTKMQLLKILQIKDAIERRYSLDIVIISLQSLLLLIICLYWSTMRLAFGHLNSFKGER